MRNPEDEIDTVIAPPSNVINHKNDFLLTQFNVPAEDRSIKSVWHRGWAEKRESLCKIYEDVFKSGKKTPVERIPNRDLPQKIL